MDETFEATVVDVREERRSREGVRWQLLLDCTAFEKGGRGMLEAVSPKGTRLLLPVLAVEQDPAGQIWHVVDKPLTAGTTVRVHCGTGARSVEDAGILES